MLCEEDGFTLSQSSAVLHWIPRFDMYRVLNNLDGVIGSWGYDDDQLSCRLSK